MKRLLLVLALLFSLHPSAHANELLAARPKPLRSALKVNGEMLTILGILMSAAGGGLGIALLTGPSQPGESGRMAAGIGTAIAGGLVGLGFVHAAIGVPLWVAGVKKERRVNGYLQASGLVVTF